MRDEEGNSKAEIVGLDTWGVLRGLESFSQLVYSTKENGYVVSKKPASIIYLSMLVRAFDFFSTRSILRP